MSLRSPSPRANVAALVASGLFAFGLFSQGAGRAGAADVIVNPVAVVFAKNDRAETIEVTNRADAPLRLEVRALAWNMQPDGGAPLEPTADLIVYPQLLTIEPHATRRIRAALASFAPANAERAYRLELNELPAFSGVGHAPGMAITFATRLLLAVYIPPSTERRDPKLSVAPIRQGKVTIVVADDGNVHSRIRSIALEGRSGMSGTSFAKTLDGATVLAGSHRSFDVDIPAQACDGTKALVVTANVDSTDLTQTIAVSPHDCAP